jgi:hypothetical protein
LARAARGRLSQEGRCGPLAVLHSGDPDRGGDRGLLVAERGRSLHGRQHPGDDRLEIGGAPRAHDEELVAAETRHDVVWPHRVFDATNRFDQHMISGLVTEAVVHFLEVIEIHEHHDEGIATAVGLDLFECFGPVEQAGGDRRLSLHEEGRRDQQIQRRLDAQRQPACRRPFRLAIARPRSSSVGSVQRSEPACWRQ